MGTAKRERQKANRQQKLQQQHKQAVRRKRSKRVLVIGTIIALAVGLVLLLQLTGDDADDAPTDSVPAGVTTTVAAVTTTTTTEVAGSTTTAAPTTTGAPTTTTEPPKPPETAFGRAQTGETPCPEADGSSPRTIQFEEAPQMCIDEAATYTAVITTNKGEVRVELDAQAAPLAVNNFVVLARYHYFDNTVCHRAIPGFVVQCGDTTGTGSGSPGYTFANENPASSDAYTFGALAMANAGQDTNGSQFFFVTATDGAGLPPDYTVFGQAVDSDDTLTALDAAGNPDPSSNGVPPAELVYIVSVEIIES